MNPKKLENMALALTNARLHCRPIGQFSKALATREQGGEGGEATRDDNGPIQRDGAYRVQEQGIQHRLNQGEKRVGLKMGLTSEAKRKQMNLDAPLYGELTDQMMVSSGGTLAIGNLIHPKIEPEVAFLMKSSIGGHNVARKQILSACSAVAPALEILDSRYDQFKYFSMEDVISDNSSSSHFIIGQWVEDFAGINLANLSLSMEVKGQEQEAEVRRGNTKAISGDPVQSIIDLCHLLAQRGRSIESGSIILAGAATPAVALAQNTKTTILLNVESLGEVSVQTVE